MAEVVAILNARPLTHLSVDPEDESSLTPNHFFFGHAHLHIPTDLFDKTGVMYCMYLYGAFPLHAQSAFSSQFRCD
jgi:hypothetical protein